MKKIIIVNNNMCVGGVQKSLYNLLWSIHGDYDITLYLFSQSGEYFNKLPSDIKIEKTDSLFHLMAISQGQARKKSLLCMLIRGILVLFSRIFGHKAAMKIVSMSQRKLSESYDYAISFLHNGNNKSFYGGINEFVLKKIDAKKKIAFVHCDFKGTGGVTEDNSDQYRQFDVIAACSEGCRRSFCDCFPESAHKCIAVKNFHLYEDILTLSDAERIVYDKEYVNVVSVSRLSEEKGIDRGIKAVAECIGNGLKIHYHIIGSGKCEKELKELTIAEGIDNHVFFYGERTNPYPFMKNADLLLMTSYHEAAPMVIDEAAALGLPVLTTQTSSSEEMVSERGIGVVCQQGTKFIAQALESFITDGTYKKIKQSITALKPDNTLALLQFKKMFED